MHQFWDKVDKSGECWMWKLRLDKDGYAQVKFKPYRGKKAHRVSYINTYGEIPEGFEIDHKCGIRHCVNPDHLQALPRKDHMKLEWERGNYEIHRKLSESQVRDIRSQYSKGGVSQRSLADEYGVSQKHISDITLGRVRRGQ